MFFLVGFLLHLPFSALFSAVNLFSLRQQERVHHHEVAGASAHDEEMEDLVAAEVFMPAVEDWKLQRVDHTAHGVDDPSGEEPSEGCRGHIVQDLGEGEYTGPAHPDIEDGRDPFRAVYPERFDQDPCDRDRPHDREEDNPGLSF